MYTLKMKFKIAKAYRDGKNDLFEQERNIFEFHLEERGGYFFMTGICTEEGIKFLYRKSAVDELHYFATLHSDGSLSCINGLEESYSLEKMNDRSEVIKKIIEEYASMTKDRSLMSFSLYFNTLIDEFITKESFLSFYSYKEVGGRREESDLLILNNERTVKCISQQVRGSYYFGINEEPTKTKKRIVNGEPSFERLKIRNQQELSEEITNVFLKYLDFDFYENLQLMNQDILSLTKRLDG